MTRRLIIGGALAVMLGVLAAASYAGWGLPEPEKVPRSVRHASRRPGTRTFLFVGAGRRHGYYGGK